MQAGDPAPINQNKFGQRVKSAFRRFGSSSPANFERRPVPPRQQLLEKLKHYQELLETQGEELRRTKTSLEASRAHYFDLLEYTSTLYNLAPVGYLTLTHEGLIIEVNQTAMTLLGSTRKAMLQQPASQYIVVEDHELFRAFCAELLATQCPQRCELRLERGTGSLFHVQMDGTLVHDILGAELPSKVVESKPYIRITVSDVTARILLEEEERIMRGQLESTLTDLRQTQAQMVKQERLAVIGQLTAGIAHDFNNILTAIRLYVQMTIRAADLPAQHAARMENVALQTERATHLVQQLLDFSRRTAMTRQPTALGPYLRQFYELLEHTLPETIRAKLDLDSLESGVDDVADIDTSRMHQVLLNLVLNARDAMPNGGEIHISLSPIQVESDFPPVASGNLSPGQWLQISVRDNGTGIDPKDLPRLFEPFFTTKDIGVGSGLGLAQVWGIIKQHEGEIGITSHLQEGSTFSIYLPAVSAAPPAPSIPEVVTIPYGHGEVVLLVEDNTFLRMALMAALKQLKYKVLDAKNGQEAANLMATEGAGVKVILSDLIMPYMGGEELIRTLRAHGWMQPVVVCSGHPQSAEKVEQLYGFGPIRWLNKPPTLTQLAHAIHESLNAQETF